MASGTADPNEDECPTLLEHPVAIFPIYSPRNPSAAIGILLKNFHEFNVLTSTKGIEVAPKSALKFDSTTYWISDANIRTWTDVDIDQYSDLLEGPEKDDTLIWRNISLYLSPEHVKVFEDLGLYMRRARDRKFRRLPGGAMTNQIKRAIYELEGTNDVPVELQVSPVKTEQMPIPGLKGERKENVASRTKDMCRDSTHVSDGHHIHFPHRSQDNERRRPVYTPQIDAAANYGALPPSRKPTPSRLDELETEPGEPTEADDLPIDDPASEDYGLTLNEIRALIEETEKALPGRGGWRSSELWQEVERRTSDYKKVRANAGK